MVQRIQRLCSDTPDFLTAKAHVYGLAHNVCLNGIEQRNLLNALQEQELFMIKEGSPGAAIIQELLVMILDGLAYGNWPWVKNAENVLEVKG